MMKNQKFRMNALHPLAIAVALGSAALASIPAQAQEESARRSTASTLLEEVIVTARKREEGAQDVPLSVSAYNSDQLEALKVRDLTSLAVGMPNVSLEDVGTTRGTANFSIRGLGINSSIPSIDPAVGVFVNGVYMGVNSGIIFDVFDLASIEVLRGPQGTLFGRNVTGGAVLLNTKTPGEELEGTARYAVDTGDEGGINSYYMGAIGGPVTDNLGARLVVYYNDDEGKFENEFNGEDFGAIEQTMVRGTVVWAPTDSTELILRYENVDIEGQGPAAQNHTNGNGVSGAFANFDRDSTKLSIDEEGSQDSETDFFTAELNWDVDFGEGTITNIFGYRDSSAITVSDIDAQPVWLFHAPAWLDATQYSNELRYSGVFADKANVTVGGLYFNNEIVYHERRNLLGIATGGVSPAASFDGGGEYNVETYNLFAQVDYDLNDQWTLTAGINYSYEEKDAKIASLSQNINSPFNPANACNIVTGGPNSCPFDFVDDENWDNLAPKLGATYHLGDDSRIYGHWTRGFRSGGYNLRNTSFDPADSPGPFDEEEVNNFELGYKSSHDWGRLNAAIFYNEIENMQRETNNPGPIGVIQVVKNTADATLSGIEVDGTFVLGENLLMMAAVGYVDAEYDEVRDDLNGDGVIDGKDEALDIPRAPELTYSLGFTYDMDIGSWGYANARINYAYRDEMAYTDSNAGFIGEAEVLDAGLDFYSNNGKWVFSLYGRNLLDNNWHGGDTQLPDTIGGVPTGGSFAPLTAGARYGAEVTYNFF
ncbi:MAG: iron complex outermembrane receptor protein [Halioglobus sp.]|jgi:iron complex outermembrane receptor protein